MKIYLTPNTAGRHGGALNDNLRYLDKYIQAKLDHAGFQSSFEEMWLTLSYPPMYVLPGVVGIEIKFKENYEKLPYSRLNRKHKNIYITLKAPEFSEHFDKQKQKEYRHKFEIDSKYQDIPKTELAKKLISKYLEAGQIIQKQLRKEDTFDYELFKEILLDIKDKINSPFLTSLQQIQEAQIQNKTLVKAKNIRNKRRRINLPKDRRIRDIRVYYNGLPKRALYPYDYQYTEIFLNLLATKELKCPTYHHLYIQVAKTREEALKNSFSLEDWYINGIALIDFENYQKAPESMKEKIVLETMINGLRDIIEIDKLDKTIFEETVSLIKKKGLNTELTYKTIENKKYSLTITYYSRSMEEKCPIFFNLTDKQSQETKRIEIGTAQNIQIPLWLQKISLTNKLIKIKSSESTRSSVLLKYLPRNMTFEIKEIMNGSSSRH